MKSGWWALTGWERNVKNLLLDLFHFIYLESKPIRKFKAFISVIEILAKILLKVSKSIRESV